MVGRKEKALNELTNYRLLELAREVSEEKVDSTTSRDDLIRIIKSSLSINEIRQKINGKSSLEDSRGSARRIGSGASVISGLIIVVLLSLPLYDFSYLNFINSEFSPLNIGDNYASGYDLAQGSMTFQGSYQKLSTQSPIIWLIAAATIPVIVFGFLALLSSDVGAERGSRRIQRRHSGHLIAITGLILILLTIIQIAEFASPVLIIIGPLEYSGDVVVPTLAAVMVTEGGVFFSGLAINRRS
jgi:hypothetical protein